MVDPLSAPSGPTPFTPNYLFAPQTSEETIARDSHPSHSLRWKSTLYTLSMATMSPAQIWESFSEWDQCRFFFLVLLSIVFKKNQPGFVFFVVIPSQSIFAQKITGLISQEGSPS